jgi:AraC-like DNA-binding protein
MRSTNESATSIFWCEGVTANINVEGFGFVINHSFMVENGLYPKQFNHESAQISIYPMFIECFPTLMTLQGWAMSPLKNNVSPKGFILNFIQQALPPITQHRTPFSIAKPSATMESKIETSKDRNLISKLESIIETHLEKHELLNIDKVATILKVNRVTLQKKFKHFHNKTIYEYYLDRKLEQACELLQYYSVQDVSKILGYSQSIKFIMVFKKKYNLTPKSYKSKYAKIDLMRQ